MSQSHERNSSMFKRFLTFFKKESSNLEEKESIINQPESVSNDSIDNNRTTTHHASVRSLNQKTTSYYFILDQSGEIKDQHISTGFKVIDNNQQYKEFKETNHNTTKGEDYDS